MQHSIYTILIFFVNLFIQLQFVKTHDEIEFENGKFENNDQKLKCVHNDIYIIPQKLPTEEVGANIHQRNFQESVWQPIRIAMDYSSILI